MVLKEESTLKLTPFMGSKDLEGPNFGSLKSMVLKGERIPKLTAFWGSKGLGGPNFGPLKSMVSKGEGLPKLTPFWGPRILRVPILDPSNRWFWRAKGLKTDPILKCPLCQASYIYQKLLRVNNFLNKFTHENQRLGLGVSGFKF
jgi:hypothetical protein